MPLGLPPPGAGPGDVGDGQLSSYAVRTEAFRAKVDESFSHGQGEGCGERGAIFARGPYDLRPTFDLRRAAATTEWRVVLSRNWIEFR